MSSKLVGTSSSTRTLDERDLSVLRPAPAAKPRAPRAKPVLRQVTNGIVCFCGERFAEAQALEFMLHLRAEAGADLNAIERVRARARKWERDHRNDPRYREQVLERKREYEARRRANPEKREQDRLAEIERMKDPAYRERRLAAARARKRKRMADPEYAERERKRSAEKYERAKADPEYRQRRSAQQRERRRKKREGQP